MKNRLIQCGVGMGFELRSPNAQPLLSGSAAFLLLQNITHSSNIFS